MHVEVQMGQPWGLLIIIILALQTDAMHTGGVKIKPLTVIEKCNWTLKWAHLWVYYVYASITDRCNTYRRGKTKQPTVTEKCNWRLKWAHLGCTVYILALQTVETDTGGLKHKIYMLYLHVCMLQWHVTVEHDHVLMFGTDIDSYFLQLCASFCREISLHIDVSTLSYFLQDL